MNFRHLSNRKKIIGLVLLLATVGVLVRALVMHTRGIVPVLATVRVSRMVVEPISAIKVDRKTDINEEILGAQVTGTCHTTGTVHVTLTPDPTNAAFQLSLIGESVSDTVGVHGPAQITSHAVTKYHADKIVTFNGRRFTTTPAKVTADTDLTIENVASTLPGLRGRIVERVATREVENAYQESRQIASERTIRLVSEGFDKSVQKHLDKLNRELKLKRLFDEQLSGHDSLAMRLATTEDYLHVVFLPKSGDHAQIPTFTMGSNLAVQVGLNLLSLAENPASTLKAIRLLYQSRQAAKADQDKPKDQPLVTAEDNRFGKVSVGTQNGWIMIHFAEKELAKAEAKVNPQTPPTDRQAAK